jgi:uncharacterized protein
MSTVGLRRGAPGVSFEIRPAPPEFDAVRLDVAGFVGVAPRGPVDEPTPVESWSAYRWLFGEGPGLLPWSVRAFFAQGGQRAYICRVSPLPRIADSLDSDIPAIALHELAWSTETGATRPDTRLLVAARDEGTWGDALNLRLDFGVQQRFSAVLNGTELALPSGVALCIGALVRLRTPRLGGAATLAWVTGLADRTDGTRRQPVAHLELPAREHDAAESVEVSVVTASLSVDDHDPALARSERYDNLGFRVGHPRFIPSVLKSESRLARPAGEWPDSIRPDPYLSQVVSTVHRPGSDRWSAIGVDSFFGPTPPELLPVEGRETAEPLPVIPGADALALTEDVSLLAAPDLLWSAATASYETEDADPAASATFADCVAPRLPTTYRHSQVVTRLDAATELDEILSRQQRLVRLADTQRRFVVLLDVPERLSLGSIIRWRNSFDSSYAAAYHPWLGVVPDGRQSTTAIFVPPSGFAAGIIAARERSLGLPWGPANAAAADAVVASTSISDAEHDALHLLDIDVFRSDSRGIRLTSAHTLSRDPSYRQLSVRRLMTMLTLVLRRQSQWLVFEPQTSEVQRQLKGSLRHLLRDLHRSGAFAGATEAESFFVRCDESINTTWSQGLGRLVAEVGVAPAQPLEYLVLRIAQDAEGMIGVEG